MNRSAEHLDLVVRSVGPSAYPDGDDFVRACLAALGVFVPRGVGARLEANGFDAGWERLASVEAQHRANQGYPVVAVLGAEVALVVPSRLGGDIYVACGGAAPRVRAPLTAAFGQRKPAFWGHE